MHKKAPLPLHPEEIALFRTVVADAQPLKPSNRIQHAVPLPIPRPNQFLADEQKALHESLHGAIDLQDRLEGGDEPTYLRPSVARSALRDLRRGRWVIQDEIDLHGLNREEARYQLASFIAQALAEGVRCVRVVHGKGLRSPGKQAILRQLVRGWLMQKDEILAYCQARPQDGGEGALVALLRPIKKITPIS